LFEKRVHAFISKDNDRLIKLSLENGVKLLRAAKAKAAARAAEGLADAAATDDTPAGA
jgi:adenylate kinase